MPPAPPQPSLNEVLTKVGDFLAAIVPAGTPVLQAPLNRVAQPARDHVIFTPIMGKRLRTNIHEYDAATQRATIEEGRAVFVQFDFYGDSAADWAATAEMLWRDPFACDILSPEAVPLYTEVANMVPLVTGEDQFLVRYTLTAVLQWNPRVAVDQGSATAIDFELVNVDERFPPT